MCSDWQSFHFFFFLPRRSGGRFYGRTGIRTEPSRVEQVQKGKSESLPGRKPSRSFRAHGLFEGMAVPYVHSKADWAAEVVQGQSSRASVLVRTFGLQETKDTIPRRSHGQKIYWLKKLKNSVYRLQVKLDLGAQRCHLVSHLPASPCGGLTLEQTLSKWRQPRLIPPQFRGQWKERFISPPKFSFL